MGTYEIWQLLDDAQVYCFIAAWKSLLQFSSQSLVNFRVIQNVEVGYCQSVSCRICSCTDHNLSLLP